MIRKLPAQVAGAVLALAVSAPMAVLAAPPLVPDPAKTPGDVLTTDKATICTPGYTQTVRDVPESLKNQVYASYGILSRQPKEYEVDHLVSLELGGSNSLRNLWPQSYETRPLNAHVKDTLENKMHALICKGGLDIRQAQQEIAADWVAAYAKYVGPVPGGVPTAHPVEAPKPGATEAQPDASGNCPASAPVKVSSSGIYHLPGGSFYRRTQAKGCYATPEAAQAAGFRASQR
ncbi:hypothetical protein [Methylomagnum ishizawai]|uniref:sunset domain-containing protein n=1 Tax=Methylomagnum ishizawai TaxID=1760988 RepID=UPI001C31EC7D|nr:hypothetical protein [Methylomagnum ishizawai]BBL77537.1 hypothetical protein MishRS11D_46350 [Methylomagnum ishizawai]